MTRKELEKEIQRQEMKIADVKMHLLEEGKKLSELRYKLQWLHLEEDDASSSTAHS